MEIYKEELSTKRLLKKYKKLGCKRVMFVASFGDRTCSVCVKLNGKVFDIDEAIKYPPVPNKKCKSAEGCRCAIVPVTELG